MITIKARDLVSLDRDDEWVGELSDLGPAREAMVMRDRGFVFVGMKGTITVCTLVQVEQSDGEVRSFLFESPSSRVKVRFYND